MKHLRYFTLLAYVLWIAGVYVIFGLGWALLTTAFFVFMSVWATYYILQNAKRKGQEKQ